MNKIVFLWLLLLLISCSEAPDREQENINDTIATEDYSEAVIDAPEIKGPQLKPVDEATQDPSFIEFRSKLLDAVERKDQEYIMNIVHPQAHLSFGATEGGKEGFRKMWFNKSNNSPLWPILKIILNNGGSFLEYEGQKQKEFSAPYVYSNWPDTLDAFQYSAIISPQAPVYESADFTSAVVAVGNYSIVKPDHQKSKGVLASDKEFPHMLGFKEWIFINNYQNKALGYVHWENIWSPVGYRAIFSKEKDQWMLKVLVAGD